MRLNVISGSGSGLGSSFNLFSFMSDDDGGFALFSVVLFSS